jgi:hypothetical protein
MRKLLVAAVAAASLIAIQAAPASADVFAGVCHFTGQASFRDGLTNQQKDNFYNFVSGAPGKNTTQQDVPDQSKCTGKLNGATVDSPVKAYVSGPGSLSCSQSASTTPGNGAVVFPNGMTFPFKFTFKGTLTEVDFTTTDPTGGTAHGTASFREYAGPQTLVDCGGNGVKQLGFGADTDKDIKFNNGLSSAAAAPAGGGGSGGGGGGGGGSNTSSGSSGTGSSGTSGTSPSKTKKSKAKCKKGKKGKCKKAKKKGKK